MFNSFISSLAPRAAGQETPALPQGLYGQEPSRWEATGPKNKPLPPLPPDRERRRKNMSNPFFHFLKKDLAPPENAFQKLKKMLHSSLHRSIKNVHACPKNHIICRCMQLDMFFIEILKIKPNSEPCSTRSPSRPLRPRTIPVRSHGAQKQAPASSPPRQGAAPKKHFQSFFPFPKKGSGAPKECISEIEKDVAFFPPPKHKKCSCVSKEPYYM